VFGPKPNLGNIIVLRIIWFALIQGQVISLLVFLFAVPKQQHPPQPVLSVVAVVMLFTVIPATFVIRRLLQNGISPDGSRILPNIGQLIFWAGCESVCFSAMIFGFVSTWTIPLCVCMGVALALQIITFPRAQ
jgi:hypothetical protein